MAAIDHVLHQIDDFIRKFYKNQILKGIIWFVGIFLGILLIFSLLEHYGWFGKSTRFVLFLIWILSSVVILVQFIGMPLLQLFKVSKGLTREQAAALIGEFFPEIGDKLLNTLQLSSTKHNDGSSTELIQAYIDQKVQNLKFVQFTTAIDTKGTLKYLKYTVPVVLVFLGFSLVFPKMVIDSSKRILQYNQVFEKPAPFKFNLKGLKKEYVEGESLVMELQMTGNAIPERIFVISEKGKELLKVSKSQTFIVDLGKAVNNGHFYFEGDDYTSSTFNYNVKKRPSLIQFSASVIYPKCFGKEPEVFTNALDLVLPEGSYISWKGITKYAHQIEFEINDSLTRYNQPSFTRSKRIFDHQQAKITLKDDRGIIYDSLAFQIQIIKDAYPVLDVLEIGDSISLFKKYFKGKVSDDNGLTALNFHYSIKGEGKHINQKITVKKISGLNDQFEFAVDFLRENVKEGDQVEYYFTLTDNDCVHGGKTVSSTKFNIKVPTKEELNKHREEIQSQVQSNLEGVQDKMISFQNNLNNLKKDINSSKQMDWKLQDKSKQLINDYQSLFEDAQKAQKEMQQNAKEMDKLSKEDQDLLEKQELLNQLMEQLMDKELKALLDKLQKLMEKNDKQEMNKLMDDIKSSSEEMNRNLDRTIENLKRMKVDEKIDQLEDKLKALAEEQRNLESQNKDKKSLDKQDVEKQNLLNNKFDELKRELDDLMDKNQELKRPLDLPDLEDKIQNTKKDMQQASDQMEKNKKPQSSQSQKSAADRMEEMAEQLDKAQNKSKEEQQGEDIDLLRNILKSLVTLSHNQEQLMKRFSKINSNDPLYKTLSKNQASLMDQFVPVSDSLMELAGRQPKIAKFIDDEVRVINTNHKLSLYDIQERRMSLLATHQQYAMTSFNNLSLMLNESLQQMQKEMQDMQQDSGSCDSPGDKGKPKPGMGQSMESMKDQLKKQLEKMEKGMEDGPNGKEKPGDGSPGGLGNKEIAKMAAEQALMRKQLEDIKSKLKGGNGSGELEDAIKQMEKQEDDIVNKRFNSSMINRQKQIMTRLLESEKAMEEREWSEERESKEGKNEIGSNLILINQYNKDKLKQIEDVYFIDPKYQKYYKDKAVQFFNH